jgi:very-short-patch-repair endonuclease
MGNDSELKYKCPYCDRDFSTFNGLSKHVVRFKAHGDISKEKLLTDLMYNGERPTCKCGCGGYTDIEYNNGAHFADFIRGHAARINNNWGHNERAKEKSAETRRRQYRNGERIQWNKGLKWSECYSDEQSAILREKLSQKALKRLETASFTQTSKLENEFIDKFIMPLGEEVIRQFYIKDINQFCDCYLPKYNLVIEINGRYWHCDPRFYKNGPINEKQKRRIEKDGIKSSYLDSHGFRLFVAWEDDIKSNPNLLIEDIKKLINQSSSSSVSSSSSSLSS